jgi:hypothetical protein
MLQRIKCIARRRKDEGDRPVATPTRSSRKLQGLGLDQLEATSGKKRRSLAEANTKMECEGLAH